MPSLADLLDDYRQDDLRVPRFLASGANDRAAVSDGTMGCHEKDVHHLGPATIARDFFGGSALVTTIETMIRDCDGIDAKSGSQRDIQRLQYLIPKLNGLRRHLQKKVDAGKIHPDYLKFVKCCLDLRGIDQWVYTVFDKGVSVRARRQIPNKSEMEKFVQTFVIDRMLEAHPATGVGYHGDLGRALRASLTADKNGLPVVHFAFGTLATIHQAAKNSEFMRFEITRVQMHAGAEARSTMSLHSVHLLHFRFAGAKLEYVADEDLGAHYWDAMGTTCVMESKFHAGQDGDGFGSPDNAVWLRAVKKHPIVVLLSYLFNHAAYPEGTTAPENLDAVVAGDPGIDTSAITRGYADAVLGSFDLSAVGGSAFQSLDAVVADDLPVATTRDRADAALRNFNVSAASGFPLAVIRRLAMFPRPELGAGSKKYIETVHEGLAFREPTDLAGMTPHHIYAGTGNYSREKIEKCRKRHADAGHPKLRPDLLVAGDRAYPIDNPVTFGKILEAVDEGSQVFDRDRRMMLRLSFM